MKVVFIFLTSLMLLNIELVNAQDLSRIENIEPFSSYMELDGFFYDLKDTKSNSELNEIGVTIFRDKYLMYSNKQRGFVKSIINEETGLPNHNIFCADIQANLDLSHPLVFSKVLNSKREQGGLTFVPDESAIYFTRSRTEKSDEFELYRGDYNEKYKYRWDDRRVLSINRIGYSIETPFIPKNKPDVIYFSSNMPGGFGGFDLYKGIIDKSGEIIEVENLGAFVNSEYDEKFPFLSEKGDYFYFSSTGHGSYGGYDVFRTSVVDEASYSNRFNLGKSLNTPADEISYYEVNEYNGYISCNTVKSPNDFNIFKFQSVNPQQSVHVKFVDFKTHSPLTNVGLILKDEFGETHKRLQSDALGMIKFNSQIHSSFIIESSKELFIEQRDTIDIINNNSGTNKHYFEIQLKRIPFIGNVVDIDSKKVLQGVEVVLLDSNKEIVKRQITDENGSFSFREIPPAPFYLSLKKKGFFDYFSGYTTDLAQGESIEKTFALVEEVDIVIVDKELYAMSGESDMSLSTFNYSNNLSSEVIEKIIVDNINFDFDKAQIKEESILTLTKVYNLLRVRANVEIEIHAHTDNKGSNLYNLRLSKSRAQAVFNHLVKRGIESTRMTFFFFGEERPKKPCLDECTQEEDAINRRVEFIIRSVKSN